MTTATMSIVPPTATVIVPPALPLSRHCPCLAIDPARLQLLRNSGTLTTLVLAYNGLTPHGVEIITQAAPAPSWLLSYTL